MNEPTTEFDTPWKDILERYFEEFILFFFPNIYPEVDWSRGFEFLDKELQQVVRDAELGRRLVDKLVKLYRIAGEETWVLVHIEVQSQEESDFARRMYVYNYRIFDRYDRSVASLAVLADERKNWRPHQFGYQLWGTEVSFNFSIVKLLDYQQEWSALESNRNPFATVVMTHLKAQETREDRSRRKQWKLTLIRRLYEQGYEREDVIKLFLFIDWMMTLPQELEQAFWQELSQYQEEKRMPYISSVERIGIQKGRVEGMREGLLKAIELGLRLKFGSEGLSLLPEISLIANLEELNAIIAGIETVNTVDELQEIYRVSREE